MSNQNEKTAAAPAQPVGPWREGRPSFKAFRPEVFLLTILTIACFAFAVKWSLPASKAAAPETSAPAATATATESAPEAAEAAPAAESAPEAAAPANAPKSKSAANVLWIWVGCLIVPALLWIVRGWAWICAVYGVKYKLVCDLDNPKASTFLIIRGIFNKKTDSLHIAQIKDISSSQTLFQKYLQGGVGTITFHTSDVTDSVVSMKNMDEPSRVFNAFDELRRHYWGRGGMQLNSGAVDAGDAVSDVHGM